MLMFFPVQAKLPDKYQKAIGDVIRNWKPETTGIISHYRELKTF